MIHPSRIREEFISQSAIAPDVFEAAVEILPDLEFDPITREVLGTPLYDELGWKYTRFTHDVKPSLVGAVFKQETRETWQVKVYGKADSCKRSGQYYAPKGIGDRPYRAPVPDRIKGAIASRYGVEPPGDDESFYDWLLANPQVPFALSEGGKKALSIISQGDAAISLYGCLCGTSDSKGRRVPKTSELAKLYRDRSVYIVLDAGDTSAKAQKSVNTGIRRLAKSILVSGGKPKIVTWDGTKGKGIDDFLAGSSNPDATWEQLKAEALDFSQWLCRNEFSLRRKPDLEIDAQKLNEKNCPLSLIPNKLVALKSPHSSGKTTLVSHFVSTNLDRGVPVIGLVQYRSLERFVSDSFGIPSRKNRSEFDKRLGLGMTLCIDSLRPKVNGFDAGQWDVDELVLVVEEAAQLVNHLLFGTGTDVERYRAQIVEQLALLCQKATKIILLDADVDEETIRFFEGLTGERSFVVENICSPGQFNLFNYEHSADWIASLTSKVANGERVYIYSASQKLTSRFGTATIEQILRKAFPDKKIDRIDSETLHCSDSEAYKHRHNLEAWIQTLDVVIVSPAVMTGVSFDNYQPDCVFGINSGAIAANDFLQSLWRVRALVDRHVFCSQSRSHRIGNGTHFGFSIKPGIKNFSQAVRLFGIFDYLTDEAQHGEVLFDSWCELAARGNRTSVYLRETFLTLVRRQQHPIILGEAMDKINRRKISQEWGNGRVRCAVSWASKANNALALTKIQAEKLSASEVLSSDERLQLDKHKCQQRYGRVTESLLLADRKGLYPRLQLLSFLLLDLEVVKRRDKRLVNQKLADNNGKAYRTDVCRTVLTPKVQLFKKLGIDDLFFALLATGEVGADSDLIAEFANRICSAKNLLGDFFGIMIRDTEINAKTGIKQTSPVRIVNQILNLVGYRLVRSRRVQVDGKRQWVYRFEFLGFDQIYYHLEDGSKVPVIDTEEVERLCWEIINHWQRTEQSLASDEPSQEAA